MIRFPSSRFSKLLLDKSHDTIGPSGILRKFSNQINKHLFCRSEQVNDVENIVFEVKRPRRALMYVPASDERKIMKAISLAADLVVLDCEDGVAISRKESARKNIHHSLEKFAAASCELGVRVNSAHSGFMEQDLKCSLTAQVLPDVILLPKVDTTEDLLKFSSGVRRAWEARVECGHKLPEQLGLIVYCESARSVLELPRLLEHAQSLRAETHCELRALVLGSDDLCSDLGITRSVHGDEIMYARQKIVLCAKAYGIQAIDMVHIDFKDLSSLKKVCEDGVSLGFSGKQVIHPSQIPIVQEAFSPSEAKVEWAKRVVEAFETQQKEGKGAFTLDGRMIDMPLLRQAHNILGSHDQENESS